MPTATPRGPSLAGGVDPPVALPGLQIYYPPAVGTPHCVIFNNGASPAYLGGSGVTTNMGMWFPPGAQLSLPFAPFPIYAVDGGITLGTVTTTLTSNTPAGGTTLTIAGTASIVAGTWLRLGNTNAPSSQELLVVSTVVNAGTITTTTPTQLDHITAGTVSVIAAQAATSLSVVAGTT